MSNAVEYRFAATFAVADQAARRTALATTRATRVA